MRINGIIRLALLSCLLVGCAGRNREVVPERPWENEEGRSEIRLKLAELMVEQGHSQHAQQILAAIRQTEKRVPPEVDLLQGRALYQEGLHLEAEHLLLSAKQNMRGDYRPLEALALLYADSERIDEAIEAYQAAVDLEDRRAHLWNNLGFLQFSTMAYEPAVESLQRAISLDGTKPRYRMNLGFALFAIGKPKDAFNAFRSVVGEVDAHYNLGHAYELSDDWQHAHSEYAKVLELDPGHQLAFEGVKRLETPEEIR